MQITCLSDLFTHVPKRLYTEHDWVFRGISSASYALVPKLFRSEPSNWHTDWNSFEQVMMMNFCRAAVRHIDLPPALLDVLALAQHHGLPTRLLDWTSNPAVALFFAVTTNCDQDGVLWALRPPAIRYSTINGYRQLQEMEDPTVYRPPHVTARIAAQEGCFTIHKIPTGTESFIPLEQRIPANRELPPILKKYEIPASAKAELRYTLDSIGINPYRLFPDLDGLCTDLWWRITGTRSRTNANIRTRMTVAGSNHT